MLFHRAIDHLCGMVAVEFKWRQIRARRYRRACSAVARRAFSPYSASTFAAIAARERILEGARTLLHNPK